MQPDEEVAEGPGADHVGGTERAGTLGQARGAGRVSGESVGQAGQPARGRVDNSGQAAPSPGLCASRR